MKTELINGRTENRGAKSTMTDAKVRKIKKWLRHKDVLNISKLARKFGTSRASIIKIDLGLTWRHIALDENGK